MAAVTVAVAVAGEQAVPMSKTLRACSQRERVSQREREEERSPGEGSLAER